MTGVEPRMCRCGEAMEFRASRQWPPPLAGRVVGFHFCHHCDEPCAGIVTGTCELCKKAGVTRR